MSLFRHLIILTFFLIVPSSGAETPKTALEVVEYCRKKIESNTLMMQEKQNFATAAFTTIVTGITPLYQQEGGASLPSKLAGKTLEVKTCDSSLTQVQVIGLSRTKVATKDQALLYVRITAAAAALGVDVINIVKHAQSLSTLRPWKEHLDLLHNFSAVIKGRIDLKKGKKNSYTGQLNAYFHTLDYSMIPGGNAYTFLDHVIGLVSNSFEADNNSRTRGIKQALTQASPHLEHKFNEEPGAIVRSKNTPLADLQTQQKLLEFQRQALEAERKKLEREKRAFKEQEEKRKSTKALPEIPWNKLQWKGDFPYFSSGGRNHYLYEKEFYRDFPTKDVAAKFPHVSYMYDRAYFVECFKENDRPGGHLALLDKLNLLQKKHQAQPEKKVLTYSKEQKKSAASSFIFEVDEIPWTNLQWNENDVPFFPGGWSTHYLYEEEFYRYFPTKKAFAAKLPCSQYMYNRFQFLSDYKRKDRPGGHSTLLTLALESFN